MEEFLMTSMNYFFMEQGSNEDGLCKYSEIIEDFDSTFYP